MKTEFDLDAYGVEEVNESEIEKTDGGQWCVDINFIIGTYSSCGSDHWTWFWELI
jgi:hypothetical protein